MMLAVALSAALLAACAAPAAELQDKDWTSADDLISTSDRIIVARFVDSQLVTVEPEDDDADSIEVPFGQFEIFETLKGTTDPGDKIWVAFDTDDAAGLFDGQGRLKQFTESETLVMFLKGRLRPLEYSSDIGAVLWSGNGEPAFAELSGDNLVFRAGRQYLQSLESKDQPDPASAAPFRLTINDIRDATR